MQRPALPLLLLLLLLLACASNVPAQMPTPSPAGPLFQERPFGPRPPPEGTPFYKPVEPEPVEIPRGWIIAGIVIIALAIAAVLYGSVNRWHSSNLFDRQYRFPIAPNPALRFGAKKCGGHLARIEFPPLVRPAGSKAKDA